jgi:tRNA (cytidine/uridine-2'-O-)-methyltransferase
MITFTSRPYPGDRTPSIGSAGHLASSATMFRIAFYQPCIPGNTGNAIRTSAATGTELHLIEPLGFDLSDAKLRRAGLDYHDLASVTIHPDLDLAFENWSGARVFAFTASAEQIYSDIAYVPGDVLLFGPEPTGLPAEVLDDPRLTGRLRIPMIAGRRSLNLSNAASIAAYEAWRQHGFSTGER